MRPAFLIVLFALAACDSGGGTPPPVVPPAVVPPPAVTPPAEVPLSAFVIPEVPARLSYEMPEQATVTPISFFGASTVPAGTYFRAASTGTGVRVSVTPTTVTIEAVAVGTTPITVTFSARGYRDSTVTIPVDVVEGVCPPPPPAGTRDYFPVQGNTVWTFGYGSTESAGNPVDIINGTLTLTFGQPSCIRGTRTWRVVQRLVGTRRPSNSAPAAPYSDEATVSVTESPAHQIEFQIGIPADLPHSASVERYRVPTGGGTQGVTGATTCTPPPGSYPNGTYPSAMEFNPDAGLTLEYMHCTTPAGRLSRTLSRRP